MRVDSTKPRPLPAAGIAKPLIAPRVTELTLYSSNSVTQSAARPSQKSKTNGGGAGLREARASVRSVGYNGGQWHDCGARMSAVAYIEPVINRPHGNSGAERLTLRHGAPGALLPDNA